MSVYTTGNWTVDHDITPSTSETHTLTPTKVPRADFSAKGNNGVEAILVNNTGSGLSVSEQLRFAANSVANVYNGSGIPAASQLSAKAGVRTLSEIRVNLLATNSVSGEEVYVPQRAWIVYETPQSPIVTRDAIVYTLNRLLGAALMDTSAASPSLADRVLAEIRGDLDPSTSV